MKEEKIILEREYVVPLRRKFLNTPKYKKTPRAIKEIKKFIARHMTLRDDDLRKVKLDVYLNEFLWFRGIRNPPGKIKVKAKKFENSILVELAEMPETLKFKKQKEEKSKKEAEKKKETKKAEKPVEETKEEKAIEKEKEESGKDVQEKFAKEEHKEMKHETKLENKMIHQRNNSKENTGN